MIKIKVRRDTLSPDIRRRVQLAMTRAMLNKAAADVLAETAKGAFNNASYRPNSWPAKKDGSTATLRKDNLLARSPRTGLVTPAKAILGSDRRYAAVHQYGSRKKGIPARRYMPFVGKKPTPLAVRRVREAIRVKMGIK
jgi:phage gpG-like protein